ncbi:MAG: hypothetical protein ACTHU0_37490 [Kofleriaceae bacterium]
MIASAFGPMRGSCASSSGSIRVGLVADRRVAVRRDDLLEMSAVARGVEVLAERQLGLEPRRPGAASEPVGDRAEPVDPGGGIEQHVVAGAGQGVELAALDDRERVDDQVGLRGKLTLRGGAVAEWQIPIGAARRALI